MKIAVIGGGWVALHIILKFSHIDIDLYCDKDSIFKGASGINQNRLHMGFHYPRSFKTRDLCINTFKKFKEDYGDILKKINDNYYAISSFNSLIDFETYVSIYKNENFDFKLENDNRFSNINNTLIKCDEMFIDPIKSKEKLINNLHKVNHFNRMVLSDEIEGMSKIYDYVFICTNDELKIIDEGEKTYELCIYLTYDIIDFEKSYNLIVMDGDFFSIFYKNEYQKTITSVKNTPIFKFKTYEELRKKIITNEDVIFFKNELESDIMKYDKNFLKTFKFSGEYSVSNKVKYKNNNGDDRSPKIVSKNNVYQFVTGKIQGIYIIEEFIKNILT